MSYRQGGTAIRPTITSPPAPLWLENLLGSEGPVILSGDGDQPVPLIGTDERFWAVLGIEHFGGGLVVPAPPSAVIPGKAILPSNTAFFIGHWEPHSFAWVTDSKFASTPTPSEVIPLHDERERVKARLRFLRRLPPNHDNEGALAASGESVDRAISFIDQMRVYPSFSATINDDGYAVIEFEDASTGFFADITFGREGGIECYRRSPGVPSEIFEGSLERADAIDFLEQQMGVVL